MKKIILILTAVMMIASCGVLVTPFIYNDEVPAPEMLASYGAGYEDISFDLDDPTRFTLLVGSLAPVAGLVYDSMEDAVDVDTARGGIGFNTGMEVTVRDERVINGLNKDGYLQINGIYFKFNVEGALSTMDWAKCEFTAGAEIEIVARADVEYSNYTISDVSLAGYFDTGSVIRDGVVKMDMVLKAEVLEGTFSILKFMEFLNVAELETLDTQIQEFTNLKLMISEASLNFHSSATMEIVDAVDGNFGCKIAGKVNLTPIKDLAVDYAVFTKELIQTAETATDMADYEPVVAKMLTGAEDGTWLTSSISVYNNANAALGEASKKNLALWDFFQ